MKRKWGRWGAENKTEYRVQNRDHRVLERKWNYWGQASVRMGICRETHDAFP